MMSEYKTFDDNKTDLFLPLIPRWITLHGFAALIGMVIIICVGVFFVNIPRTIILNIRFDTEMAYAIVDLDQWTAIKDEARVSIRTPFQDSEVEGQLNKAGMWTENERIVVPIIVSNYEHIKLRIKNEFMCKGETVGDNAPLFLKIFAKSGH